MIASQRARSFVDDRIAKLRSPFGMRMIVLALLVTASCRESTSPPDIVVVVIDTLRADHVGLYGHERATTPGMDALAEQGVWFSRAYSHSGWTLPSVTSLLTGRLPHEHGVGRDPRQVDRFGCLGAQTPSLPELLTPVGYRCGAIINNTFLAPEFGVHRGFHDYDYVGATKERHRTAKESVSRAIEWLADQSNPAFLLLHVMEPHLLYAPPEEVRGTFADPEVPLVEMPFAEDEVILALRSGQRILEPAELDYLEAVYDEEILAVDRALVRLFDHLKGRSDRDTAIFVTADHGEEFFDHGSVEHGHTLYSELTRVPLVLHAPGVSGGRVDTLVQHVDVFATILRLAGVDLPPGARGTDLRDLVRGESPARVSLSENVLYGPPRVSLVTETHRLQVNLMSRQAEVWTLDSSGMERERLSGDAMNQQARELTRQLQDLRGDLSPGKISEGPAIPDMEVFEQLRALGYLRDS